MPKISVMPKNIPSELLQAFARAGQDHVFRFWNDLTDPERDSFAAELREIDLREVAELAATRGEAPFRGQREPAPVVRLGEEPRGTPRTLAAAHGHRLITQGKVGVFLVAGGQGSRLGFEGPKGCFPAGPLSRKTIFQLHAEKLVRLRERSGASLPWYIMTSQANDAETRKFFESHRFFGLDPRDVMFLPQRMLPALDTAGKLVLQSKGRLFQSPNGHGGSYAAFKQGGALADAQKRGIEQLFYFQVDNILVRIADPIFVGLHALSGSEMSLKVLSKTGPEEKMGVVAIEDGQTRVIEYSDFSRAESEARDSAGPLIHWAGSIAIHMFDLGFFERVAEGAIQLPHHLAKKKLSTIDTEGKPTEVDGIKYESFVFDALPSARKSLSLEVARREEFAPIKNKTGVDSIESAHALYIEEHRRWAREAGLEVSGELEISPLAALDPEELRERLAPESKGKRSGSVLLDPDADGKVRARSSALC